MALDANPLYVEKRMLLVHIYLSDGRQIKGALHTPPRVRLTDMLNFQFNEKPFLPLTDIQLINQNGEETNIPFMVINRKNIMGCIPLKSTQD